MMDSPKHIEDIRHDRAIYSRFIELQNGKHAKPLLDITCHGPGSIERLKSESQHKTIPSTPNPALYSADSIAFSKTSKKSAKG